mmetsp:Transcript_4953/g.10573  ORF Transcript_4953/g.10573 Transcript_4953/m.10573 type:complete len:115 (+) Transcript_4953:5584-5928(+)
MEEEEDKERKSKEGPCSFAPHRTPFYFLAPVTNKKTILDSSGLGKPNSNAPTLLSLCAEDLTNKVLAFLRSPPPPSSSLPPTRNNKDSFAFFFGFRFSFLSVEQKKTTKAHTLP